MLVHVHVRLTTKELEQLRQRIGFIPDKSTVRAWARSLILDTLQPEGKPRPIETAEQRRLLEVVS